MTKVLVLDNYDSFVYNLVQYLGELGAERVELALTGGGLNQRLELSPGATRTFTANASSIVRLSASGLVATSLVVDVDYAIAVLTMQEQRNLGGRVGVLVR